MNLVKGKCLCCSTSVVQVFVSLALTTALFTLVIEVTLLIGLVLFTFLRSFKNFWVYVYCLGFGFNFMV